MIPPLRDGEKNTAPPRFRGGAFLFLNGNFGNGDVGRLGSGKVLEDLLGAAGVGILVFAVDDLGEECVFNLSLGLVPRTRVAVKLDYSEL